MIFALQGGHGEDPKAGSSDGGSTTGAELALKKATPQAEGRQALQDYTPKSVSSEAIPLPAELWRLRRLGPLDEERVEIGPILGRGGYGKVFKGTNLAHLTPPAVVFLALPGLHPTYPFVDLSLSVVCRPMAALAELN